MSLDRVLTGTILLFGLVFYFLVMPGQVETVGFGRIVPSTVPSIAIWLLILTAAIQFISTPDKINTDFVSIVRAVLFIALIVFAVWAMDRIGFEYIAPPFALAAMLMIGERRWYWLLVGSLVIPLGTWLIVERLLDRVLA